MPWASRAETVPPAAGSAGGGLRAVWWGTIAGASGRGEPSPPLPAALLEPSGDDASPGASPRGDGGGEGGAPRLGPPAGIGCISSIWGLFHFFLPLF